MIRTISKPEQRVVVFMWKAEKLCGASTTFTKLDFTLNNIHRFHKNKIYGWLNSLVSNGFVEKKERKKPIGKFWKNQYRMTLGERVRKLEKKGIKLDLRLPKEILELERAKKKPIQYTLTPKGRTLAELLSSDS